MAHAKINITCISKHLSLQSTTYYYLLFLWWFCSLWCWWGLTQWWAISAGMSHIFDLCPILFISIFLGTTGNVHCRSVETGPRTKKPYPTLYISEMPPSPGDRGPQSELGPWTGCLRQWIKCVILTRNNGLNFLHIIGNINCKWLQTWHRHTER